MANTPTRASKGKPATPAAVEPEHQPTLREQAVAQAQAQEAAGGTTMRRSVARGINEAGEAFELTIKPMHYGEALDHPSATSEYKAFAVATWVALDRPTGSFDEWFESLIAFRTDLHDIPPTNGTGRKG